MPVSTYDLTIALFLIELADTMLVAAYDLGLISLVMIPQDTLVELLWTPHRKHNKRPCIMVHITETRSRYQETLSSMLHAMLKKTYPSCPVAAPRGVVLIYATASTHATTIINDPHAAAPTTPAMTATTTSSDADAWRATAGELLCGGKQVVCVGCNASVLTRHIP